MLTQTTEQKELFHNLYLTLKARLRNFEASQKACKIHDLRWEITATLNFYLEFRNRPYRHGNDEYWACWRYKAEYQKLQREFAETLNKLSQTIEKVA